ncbi:ergothioneine biosynthesis protein EgtB [soil metagenome]
METFQSISTKQLEINSENEKLLSRYNQIRKQTEFLCSTLETEDFVVQPMVDVSPPKWHLGHLTWFFEQFVLYPNIPYYQWYDKHFPYIFNSYYETVGKRILRTNRGNITRPGVKEVFLYRAYVDEHINKFLANRNVEIPADILDVIELGLQHEQQHQELLLYDIKYILGNNPLFPKVFPKDSILQTNNTNGKDFEEIKGGIYQIGCESKETFCYDNELGVHKVFLHDFKICKSLVTNEEYLKFMEAGGYKNFKNWLSEGWDWVKHENIKSPYYWHQIEGEWYRYSLHGLKKIDLKAPVSHVSFYEAAAFAKWKGLRMPTEEEWEVACQKICPSVPKEANFQDSEYFEPIPQMGKNPQFYGDVWEWTASSYRPYPFFKEPEGAIGEYNGKFMINQIVLRGGSCATPRDHIRPTYRNFFHPHLRWMFSGIRLAQHI